jgi:hypothetical protein
MQAPVTGLTHDWLRRLLGYTTQPGIAAAGPIVLAPDGRIAEAGIAIPDGIPLPLLHGQATSMDDLFGFGTSVHNVVAVSGVALVSRSAFDQLGGLRSQFGDLALVELCIRASAAGLRTVTVPDARVRLQTTDYVANDLEAIWRMRSDWAAGGHHDPYYSPRYRTDRGDFAAREVVP